MGEKEFWKIIGKANWKFTGDDDKVLAPVIDALSKLDDKAIFGFEDMMSKLLYDIDSQEIALQLYGDQYFSGDLFLYQRCVALINGAKYYKSILTGKEKLNPDLEFEAILYVPHRAWAKKHQADPGDYPHFPGIRYETGSNEKQWTVDSISKSAPLFPWARFGSCIRNSCY